MFPPQICYENGKSDFIDISFHICIVEVDQKNILFGKPRILGHETGIKNSFAAFFILNYSDKEPIQKFP